MKSIFSKNSAKSPKIDFQKVLAITKETIFDELSKYRRESFSKEILIDGENCFRAVLKWKNCIGEIIVENGGFAPHRFVNFCILASDADEIKSVFCYQDSSADCAEIIKSRIREGIGAGFLYAKRAK